MKSIILTIVALTLALPLTSNRFVNELKKEERVVIEKEVNVTDIRRELIIEEAKKHINKPYIWGSKGPNSFDCSGFTSYILNKFQIEVSPGSSNQYLAGQEVEIEDAKSGDLLFFSKNYMDKTVKHVGLIIKSEGDVLEIIHATSSKGIIVEDVNKSNYWKPKILNAKKVIPEVKLQTSNKLLAYIADMEHFSEFPINCNGWAIGYGHLISNNELEKYKQTGISKEEALELLKKDILLNEEAVRKLFKDVNLTSYQFDALVSLSYNMGIGNLKKKHLTKLLLNNVELTEKDFINTLSENTKSEYRGLIKRRKTEYKMFNNIYEIQDSHNLLEYE